MFKSNNNYKLHNIIVKENQKINNENIIFNNDIFQISSSKNDIIYYNLPNELKLDKENIIQKYKGLSLKNKDNFKNKENFNSKVKEGYNYPFYPNHKKGKFMLSYIRNYLLKKNKIKKKVYFLIIFLIIKMKI